MSEFHNPSDASSNPESVEPIRRHPKEQQDDAGHMADQILDWLDTIDEESFSREDDEALERMLNQLETVSPVEDKAVTRSSLVQFHQKYAPLFETRPHTAAPKSHAVSEWKQFPRTFRRLAAAVAIMAIMLGCMVTVQAFGLDVFGAIARWTAETFQLQSQDRPYAMVTINPLQEGERAEYDSVDDVLDAFGITAPLIPQWVPERFELSGITAVNASGGVFISIDYICENEFLQMRFREAVVNTSVFEREETTPEIISDSGISHYVSSDMNRYKVYWQNGEIECRISGTVSEEELREIITSIYRER